jgi:hypothetical protein
MKNGLEQIQAQYAPLGFTFENRLAAMAADLKNGGTVKPAKSVPAKGGRLGSNGSVKVPKLAAH